jgi:hypothetical protein
VVLRPRPGRTLEELRADDHALQRSIAALQIRWEQGVDARTTTVLDRALPDSVTFYRLVGLDPTSTARSGTAWCECPRWTPPCGWTSSSTGSRRSGDRRAARSVLLPGGACQQRSDRKAHIGHWHADNSWASPTNGRSDRFGPGRGGT